MIYYDIVVIGGGPAGMAAAVAAYDSGVTNIAIIDREEQLGGVLQQCIHNGFGIHKLGGQYTGPEYAEHYMNAVRQRGIAVFCETTVTNFSWDKVITARNKTGIIKMKASAIVLAMGCRERSRGALNICGTRPAGVFSAGAAQKLMNCDGYRIGNKAVILGSGDIGLIMARRLTLEGTKVEAVCELQPYSGGLTRNIVQCLEDFNIPLYLSTTVVEIHGHSRVEGVTVAAVDEKRQIIEKSKRFIPCDTVLFSVGLIPENELSIQAGMMIHPTTGGAIVDEHRQTNIPGVFACGNVLHVHDLVDYVSDEAELAGTSAAAYVHNNLPCGAAVSVQSGEGIRYVLPQTLNVPVDKDVTFYMRVMAPTGKVRISMWCKDSCMASVIRSSTMPGEMEKLHIKRELMHKADDTITIRLEELT